jgi:glycosyltransferase involved in cell wall biosynthesis
MDQASDLTLVFMGALNGERFIGAQLDSIVRQTVPVHLIVSDDGSTDQTQTIVRTFAQSHAVFDQVGPRQGFARNFLSVFQRSDLPRYAWLAFADQDDLWDVDHLERAQLEIGLTDVPVIHGSATRLIDGDDRDLGKSQFLGRSIGFPNALVQSFAGGNTLVMNHAAVMRLQRILGSYDGSVEGSSHDWILYQLMTAIGARVIYRSRPSISYRQHGANLVGENQSLRARFRRAIALVDGRFKQGLDSNERLLSCITEQMTDGVREQFARYQSARRRHGWCGFIDWLGSGVRRGSQLENSVLHLAYLAGRI